MHFILIALVMLLLLSEVGIRLSGIADFPLYDANSVIGYVPKASQAGKFLSGSQWQFNSKHMGAPEFSPTVAVDNLLIGDSIVFGGAPYSKEERLGPQLNSVINEAVWPVSASSWALRNELAYLRLHPDVVNDSDRIIFVLNSGDFSEASSWSCDSFHPRGRPALFSWYVLRKYLLKDANCGQVQENMKVAPGKWRDELISFLSSKQARSKRIVIVLYPNIFQYKDANILYSELELYILDLVSAGIDERSIISVARDSRWKSKYYLDDIHPSPEGMRVLADIIGSSLEIDISKR